MIGNTEFKTLANPKVIFLKTSATWGIFIL